MYALRLFVGITYIINYEALSKTQLVEKPQTLDHVTRTEENEHDKLRGAV